jgi:sarcosine reductase
MDQRRLELANYRVEKLAFGNQTRLDDGTLFINKAELTTLFDRAAPSLERIDVELVHPGESARVIHLLDAVEPRVKVEPLGHVAYPGLLGPARTAGSGRTNRLHGVSIIQSGLFPNPTSGILAYWESIVEMSGPGAPYCACADTANIVLLCKARSATSNEEFDRDIRAAGLAAADYVARTTLEREPDETELFALDTTDPALPRVVFIMQIQQQGFMVNKLFYGHHLDNIVPTVLHPNEVLDGAIVSAHYHGNIKIPTSMYANHPVIRSLYAHHGRDLTFAGVVMSRGYNATHALKERTANAAANLVQILGGQAALVAFEGTGNTWIDLMLTVQECERRGIPTVPIIHELGGPDGTEFPVVDCVPEAVSIISTGSTERFIPVPAVSRAIGGREITFNVGHQAGLQMQATAPLTVTPQVLFGGYWQMGISGFRCVAG